MDLFVLFYSISDVCRFVSSHVQGDKCKGTYVYFSIYIRRHYTLVPSYTRFSGIRYRPNLYLYL
jgi:hypothetical protein